jgi:hypothetical protein
MTEKLDYELQINMYLPEKSENTEELLQITKELLNKLLSGKFTPAEVGSVIINVAGLMVSISKVLDKSVTREEILLYMASGAKSYDDLDKKVGRMKDGESRVLQPEQDPYPDFPSIMLPQHMNVNLSGDR